MERTSDMAQQVFPFLRRLRGRDVYYSIEGPRRVIEWQRVGEDWTVFHLVARAFPEVQRIADMMMDGRSTGPEAERGIALSASSIYEAVSVEDWPDFQGAANGLLPGQTAVVRASGEPNGERGGTTGCAEIERDVQLAGSTTFGVAAKAKRLVVARTDEAVRRALLARTPGEPLLVLGGGSNMLFHDDYPGLVLKIEIGGVVLTEAGGSDRIEPRDALVVAGAGVVHMAALVQPR